MFDTSASTIMWLIQIQIRNEPEIFRPVQFIQSPIGTAYL